MSDKFINALKKKLLLRDDKTQAQIHAELLRKIHFQKAPRPWVLANKLTYSFSVLVLVSSIYFYHLKNQIPSGENAPLVSFYQSLYQDEGPVDVLIELDLEDLDEQDWEILLSEN